MWDPGLPEHAPDYHDHVGHPDHPSTPARLPRTGLERLEGPFSY
jgi:hypothetical protein